MFRIFLVANGRSALCLPRCSINSSIALMNWNTRSYISPSVFVYAAHTR